MDLSGWVGVGLGGNCDCRCGILYAPMLHFYWQTYICHDPLQCNTQYCNIGDSDTWHNERTM